VDALGIAATCRNALMSLRKRGRHLQIGLTTAAEKGEVSFPVDRIVLMELQLNGSMGMQASRYPAMLRMVETRKLSPKLMVTGTIPLEQASGVLQQMSTFENVGVTVINQY
jgi:D-arabinose 1-dehydrogenase-like Zn-dependent alcohol dehydrogenase